MRSVIDRVASIVLSAAIVSPSAAVAQTNPVNAARAATTVARGVNCPPEVAARVARLAGTLTEADLAARVDATGRQLFMHDGTFPPAAEDFSWPRDGAEMEAAFNLTPARASGFDAKEFHTLLSADDWRGFRRLRDCKPCAAFTSGVDHNQMPWDAQSHALREGLPYVWMAAEDGRFEQEVVDGVREGQRVISRGTDLMDDYLVDNATGTLFANGIVLRPRNRWDNWRPADAPGMSRMLVAVKRNRGVGADGVKRAAKFDVRVDGPTPEQIASLIEDTRAGTSTWANGPEKTPIVVMKSIWEEMKAKGELPQVGALNSVLAVEEKATLRSYRSRYHLDPSEFETVRRFFDLGNKRLTDLVALAEQRLANGTTGPADPQMNAFIARAKGVLDNTGIVDAVKADLLKLDPAMTVDAASVALLGPASETVPATILDVKKSKVVADARKAAMNEISQMLQAQDDALLGRIIAGPSETSDAALFRNWARNRTGAGGKVTEQAQELRAATTYEPFVQVHADVMASPAKKGAARKAFNEYGTARRTAGDEDFANFEPFTQERFAAIGPQLAARSAEVYARQIEAGGTAGQGMWFARAREVYLPNASLEWGNFYIDTIDLTGMYHPDAWKGIPQAERSNQKQPNPDHLFGATLVNDVQIELGREKPFLDRIHALERDLDTDRASIFMKWASATQAQRLPVHDGRSYSRLWREYNATSDEALAPVVAEINAFGAAQGSKLDPMTVQDFRRFADVGDAERGDTVLKLLTKEVKDRPVRANRETEEMLVGARFVMDQYVNTTTYLANAKNEHMVREMERLVERANRGGQQSTLPKKWRWEPVKQAKGETALRHIFPELAP